MPQETPTVMQPCFATFLVILALVLCLLPAASRVSAADWPQFRGPNRDGRWEETTGILESFPRGGLKIRWRHPVGGGFSRPVVAEGRGFVFDVALTKPKSRERLHCYNEKTGKEPAAGEWVDAGVERRHSLRELPPAGKSPPLETGPEQYINTHAAGRLRIQVCLRATRICKPARVCKERS